jgi:hypothetical protein
MSLEIALSKPETALSTLEMAFSKLETI